MRLNKLFIASLLALSTMMLQSCLKDQEDIFDESSSERLQAALDNAKTVLTSSENGWIFDYYPDRDLSYGGFVYAVKFDNTKATVRCELQPDDEESSLYKLTDDNGPMLSFDTYNSLMHYFATPGNGAYEAMDGDFEFMIMDVSDDLIKLRGKRTGNTMYLHRLNEDPETYIKAVAKTTDTQVLPSVSGTIGSTALRCDIDIDIHYMELFCGDDTEASAAEYFVSTPTGIRFYNPVQINGSTITELNYAYDDVANIGQYSGEDSSGNQIATSGTIPDNYAFISEFSGSFTFDYYRGNLPVTLEADKISGIVLIKGLNSNYDLIATYKKSRGCLELCGQTLNYDGTHEIFMCPWALNPLTGTGSISTSEDNGILFFKDPENPNTYLATPNSSFGTTSFIIFDFTADGYTNATSPWLIGGSYQVPWIDSLTKK